MDYNLIEDISKLSNIKPVLLNKLINISNYCICDYIDNLCISEHDTLNIDIGIGNLYINLLDDEIEYKFIPSKKLEKGIIRTVVEGENSLTNAIEAKLNTRVLNTYKELL